MHYSTRGAAVLLALVATLSIAPVAPEAGNVIFLTVGALSLTLMFRNAGGQLRRPIVWMTLSGLVLMAIAYTIGANSVEGLVGIAYFSPLFAILPLLAAAEDMKGEESSGLFAILALAGVASPAIVSVQEFAGTGTMRAGGAIANPIHFADVALLVGFVACAGLVARAERWRLLFLAGPVFAAVAVVLSGTRGAVVALFIMLVVAAIQIVVLRLVSRKAALLAFALLVVSGIIALWLGATQLSGIQRLLVDIADIASFSLPTDEGASVRLTMIWGGYKAFLMAPIFGHGPIMFVHYANNLVATPFGLRPHLHNDIADFAASAGVTGLLAYVLFMLAPIVEAMRMPASPNRSRIIMFAVTLMSGYFVMGLTNAMFGILTVTTYYAVICIVIGILTRQASNAPYA